MGCYMGYRDNRPIDIIKRQAAMFLELINHLIGLFEGSSSADGGGFRIKTGRGHMFVLSLFFCELILDYYTYGALLGVDLIKERRKGDPDPIVTSSSYCR